MCAPICLTGLLQREQKYKCKSPDLSDAASTGSQNDGKSILVGNESNQRTSPVTAIETPFKENILFNDGDIYDAETRQTICTWMFNTVDYLKHSRELVHIAMQCVDRYASIVPIKSTNNLNLVTVAALSIVLKSSNTRSNVTQLGYLDFFVRMSKNLLNSQDIIHMETHVLNKLSWYVNPPTPQAFLEEFNQIWKATKTFDGIYENINFVILEVANYIVDCTLVLSNFKNQPRSLIALGAILLSMKDVTYTVLNPSKKQKAVDNIISYFQNVRLDIPNPLTFSEASDIAFEIESLLFGNTTNSVSSYKTLLSLYKAIDPNSFVYNHTQLALSEDLDMYHIPVLPNRKRKSSTLVSP